MTPIQAFVGKRPLLVFYFLAILIAVLAMLLSGGDQTLLSGYWEFNSTHNLQPNLWAIVRYGWEEQPRFFWTVFFFAGAPSIAALITLYSGWGGKGLRILFSRLRFWRGEVTRSSGLKIYGGVLLIYIALVGLFVGVSTFYSDADQLEKMFDTFGGGPVTLYFLLFLASVVDEGGLLEEMGWRGFALPILLQRMRNPLRVSVVLGTLWMCWHLPREIPTLLSFEQASQYLQFAAGQLSFWILCVAISIAATYLFNITGGSVWAGILVHGGYNALGKGFAPFLVDVQSLIPFPMDLRGIVAVIIAGLILLAAGQNMGKTDTPDPPFP